MADSEHPGGAKSTRLSLLAVAAMVLLVLGTIFVDSLRRPVSPTAEDTLTEGQDRIGTRPPEIPRSADDLSPPVPRNSAQGLSDWRDLLKSDPAAAAASLGQVEGTTDRDELLLELMQHWTASSPDEAGEWLLAQARGNFRDEAAAEFSRAWAKRDPQATARWIAANIDTAAADRAIGGLLAKWVPVDSDAALKWFDSIENQAARQTAGDALAYTWSQTSPRDAARWVAELDDPALKASTSISLVCAWSSSDPAAAAAWLTDNITEPAERDAAALPLLLTWADADAVAASRWVASLPAGELQEASKTIFAESLAIDAPEDAIVWARSILDSERRNESILNIYEDWMEEDKPALVSHLKDKLADNSDPELREEIYDLLYENDDAFRDELLLLYEEREP